MKVRDFVLLGLPVICATAQTTVQFVSVSSGTVEANGVVPLAGGGVAIYGYQLSTTCTGACLQGQAPLFAVLNAAGQQTSGSVPYGLGSGDSIINSAAVDTNGNIWITGTTTSDNFPLVSPLITFKPDYQQTGFVARLSPSLQLLFSTFLGGQTASSGGQTTPESIALDSSGNACLTGGTSDPAFPVTGPVFGSSLSPAGYAFITGIASDGSKVLFSRLLGGSSFTCTGFNCTHEGPGTIGYAIAVDASGNVTVAGTTNPSDFPVTPNVYSTPRRRFHLPHFRRWFKTDLVD